MKYRPHDTHIILTGAQNVQAVLFGCRPVMVNEGDLGTVWGFTSKPWTVGPALQLNTIKDERSRERKTKKSTSTQE